MATTNPLLDDLAGMMTGAMGAARTASEEAKTAMHARVRGLIADFDLAEREDIEVLKELLTGAIERIKGLEARVNELEREKEA